MENLVALFDSNDADVPGFCHGYICPLFLRIYSRHFVDSRFNGYYGLNYVGRLPFMFISPPPEKCLMILVGKNNVPSYKHTSRNLYIWREFCNFSDIATSKKRAG